MSTSTNQPAVPVLPPVITALLNDQGPVSEGGSTDDTTPTLKGTAQPGSLVQVYDNGVKIGQTLVGADWSWSFTPDTDLGTGAHSFTVIGSHADGTGATPAPYAFNVTLGAAQTTPVLPPVITGITDDVGANQGTVSDGGQTDDGRPTLKGTGEPGSLVTVYDNGNEIGTAVVGADWQWSFTPAQELPAGQHCFTAVGSHADGTGSTPAVYPYTITTNSGVVTPVLPPVITGITDDVGATQGQVHDSGSTDDTRPTLQGTGQPGSVITVYDNGVLIGKAVTGADWQWSFTPAQDLSAGQHTFTVVGSHADGTGSTAATYGYTINLGATPVPSVLPPVITDVLDDVGSGQGKLNPGSSTDDTQPTVKGTSEPGTKIELFDNGVKVGETITGADWQWSVTPATPLSNGVHVFTAVASRIDGTGSSQAPYAFPLQVNAGSLSTAPTPVILQDSNNDGWLNQAEAQDRLSVVVKLPGEAKVGDLLTVTDSAGNVSGKLLTATDLQAKEVIFTQTFPTSADGSTLSVSAKLTNAAGVSSPVGTDTVKVDTSAPTAPVLSISTDDNRDGQISRAEAHQHGQIDVRVSLSSTALAGDVLVVTDQSGASVTHTLTAQDIAAGAVNFDDIFQTPGEGQTVTLDASLTDTAGNTSNANAVSAVVHTQAPSPVIHVLQDRNEDGTMTRPELGSAARVDVRIDLPTNVQVGDKLAVWDNNGNGVNKTLSLADITAGSVTFAQVFPLPTADSDIAVSAQLTDILGNVSPEITNTVYFDGNHAPLTSDDAATVRAFATPTISLIAMGQDTGGVSAAGKTWFTADGDAGRAVYGKLTALLTPDMTVQLSSSDHPGVWHDAVLSSDGIHWTAVDSSAHSSSWNYSARVIDGSGNVVAITEQTVGFSDAPLMGPVIDDFGTASGDHSIAVGASTADQTLVVNGHSMGGESAAGHTIEVFVNGIKNPVGTTTVAADGTWSLDLTDLTLANGLSQYNFYAREIDGPGNTSTWSNQARVTIESPMGALENWANFGEQTSWTGNGTGIIKGSMQTVNGTVSITSKSSNTYYNGVQDLSGNLDRNYYNEFSASATKPVGGEANALMVYNGATMTLSFDKAVTNPDLWFWNLYGNVTITAVDASGKTVTPVLRYVDNTPATASALGAINANTIGGNSAGQGIVEVVGSYTSITLTQTNPAGTWYGLQVAQKTMTGGLVTVFPTDDGSIVAGASPASKAGDDVLAYFTQADLDLALSQGLEGGQGVDTLQLGGRSMVLNLTDYSSTPGQANAINNYEKFDLGIGGKNTLTMSVNDVLNAGETDLFIQNGKTQVMVTGDASDTLSLKHLIAHGGDTGNWAVSGTVVVDGVTYTTFDHSTLSAQILVQKGVNVLVPADAGVAAEHTAYKQTTGNVLTNDSDPDGTVSQLSVAGVSTSANGVIGQGVGQTIEGQYGHLTLNANGSYTYVADKSGGLTSAVNDVFYYINRDAHGENSQSPAKLVIKVDPALSDVLSVSAPDTMEGEQLEFTVMTSASAVATTMSLELISGSGTVGVDTIPGLQVNLGQGWVDLKGSSVTLAPNTSSFQVRVSTLSDDYIELDETVRLKVTSSAGSSVSGIGTLIDNDLHGSATGMEDSPLTLTWAHFNLTNLPYAQPKLTITSLPADGSLQFNQSGTWTAVTTGQVINKVDIDAGKLRFVPDTHEAGADGYGNGGIGNKSSDYARFTYSASDVLGTSFDNAVMNIDITPSADLGTLSTTMVFGGFVYNTSTWPTTFSRPQGSENFLAKVSFTVSGTSPDVDGSERTVIGLSKLQMANGTQRVFSENGSQLTPDSNGMVWLDPTKTYYVSAQSSSVNFDYNLYRQEVTDYGKVLHQAGGSTKNHAYTYSSPMILDLDGDGVQTLSIDHGVTFDLHATGTAVKTGWSDQHDGLLVLDRNGDGHINSGSELFGEATTLADGSKAKDGFQALADQDSNHDGVISAADTRFSELQVWVDGNSDGLTQQGELQSLVALGITSLSLAAQADNTVQNGNFLGLSSTFTTADGVSHQMSDVWFANSALTETGAASAGLDADSHALDALLANAGLSAQVPAAAPAAVPTEELRPLSTAQVALTAQHLDWVH